MTVFYKKIPFFRCFRRHFYNKIDKFLCHLPDFYFTAALYDFSTDFCLQFLFRICRQTDFYNKNYLKRSLDFMIFVK
jgi:hypothetical protein